MSIKSRVASIQILEASKGFIIVVVQVDNILITENDLNMTIALKHLLDVQFNKDLGEMKYYLLGLEVRRTKDEILLGQRKIAQDLLKSAEMTDVKPLTIPLDQHTQLHDSALSGDLLHDLSTL